MTGGVSQPLVWLRERLVMSPARPVSTRMFPGRSTGRLAAAWGLARQHGPARQQADDPYRHAKQEDPPPAEGAGDRAADRRADQLRDGDGREVETERVIGAALRHQFQHQGSVVGPDRGGPDGLAGFERDEQPHGRSDRGEEAGHGERAEGRQVDIPAADEVADAAHAEHERGAGDRGREDDKDSRQGAGLEMPDDRRDRDAEHGGAQADEERGQRYCRQRQGRRHPPRHACGARAGHAGINMGARHAGIA